MATARTAEDRQMGVIGEQYRDRLVRRGRNPASVRNFERAWTILQNHCAELGTTPREMSEDEMGAFFHALSYAPTTKKMYLAQIRAAFRYAVARGVVAFDPTADVELPTVPDRQPRTFTNAKLREFKANCHNTRQWLIFHLYAYTGCRKNEIRELTWENVSLEDETLFVVGKGGKGRLVPIHPALGEVLANCKRNKPGNAVLSNPYGHPFHYTYYDHLLKSFAPEATFHDFRRTVASSLDANGVEEGLIMRIMGWAPKTVFDRHYRAVAPERLHAAILKLYADDPL